MKLKLIAIAVCCLVPSCGLVTGSFVTPYGEIKATKKGNVKIKPRVVVIPTK